MLRNSKMSLVLHNIFLRCSFFFCDFESGTADPQPPEVTQWASTLIRSMLAFYKVVLAKWRSRCQACVDNYCTRLLRKGWAILPSYFFFLLRTSIGAAQVLLISYLNKHFPPLPLSGLTLPSFSLDDSLARWLDLPRRAPVRVPRLVVDLSLALLIIRSTPGRGSD